MKNEKPHIFWLFGQCYARVGYPTSSSDGSFYYHRYTIMLSDKDNNARVLVKWNPKKDYETVMHSRGGIVGLQGLTEKDRHWLAPYYSKHIDINKAAAHFIKHYLGV